MRRFAVGVALAALLTLFVAVVTRTSEKRAEGQETATVLMVSVECPCGGECEAHAGVACDPASEAEAEVGAVLKLPIRSDGSPRSDNRTEQVTVINSGLRSGARLKLPNYVDEIADTTAATVKGHFSVGVL